MNVLVECLEKLVEVIKLAISRMTIANISGIKSSGTNQNS